METSTDMAEEQNSSRPGDRQDRGVGSVTSHGPLAGWGSLEREYKGMDCSLLCVSGQGLPPLLSSLPLFPVLHFTVLTRGASEQGEGQSDLLLF